MQEVKLHEILLVPVLLYGSETMLWKEKERPKVSAVQVDNLRGDCWVLGGWIES